MIGTTESRALTENRRPRADDVFMTWIKICGITNLEDALTAVDAGADAVGFVFYEKSPRTMVPARVREIVKELPDRTEKVGVFVMAPEAEMESVADEAGLTGWQLYKDLSGTPLETALRDGGFFCLPKHKSASGRKVYIALPANLIIDGDAYRGLAWAKGADAEISCLLIDSGSGATPGGTGKVFNWAQLANPIQCLSLNFKVVVAGGLNPTNVTEAMQVLHPWGVDVSSGV